MEFINNSVDFYEIEHCLYTREGDGSILKTSELKKLLKIDIFVSLCNNSHIKELLSRKFSGLLRIKCQVWAKNEICNIFQNREGQSNV